MRRRLPTAEASAVNSIKIGAVFFDTAQRGRFSRMLWLQLGFAICRTQRMVRDSGRGDRFKKGPQQGTGKATTKGELGRSGTSWLRRGVRLPGTHSEFRVGCFAMVWIWSAGVWASGPQLAARLEIRLAKDEGDKYPSVPLDRSLFLEHTSFGLTTSSRFSHLPQVTTKYSRFASQD